MRKKNLSGDHFEIRFLEGVIEKSPRFIEALILLGDLYTKNGFIEKGLSIDQRLVHLRPEDPMILYNLACSYSLLEKPDKAFEVMKLAVQSGYQDFVFLQKDCDLVNLRQYPPFQDFFLKTRMQRKES